jgi:hypothetical protein
LTSASRSVLLLAAAAALLCGQTAILECVSAAESGPAVRLRFRAPPPGMTRIQRATLLLHVRDGSPPSTLKLNGRDTASAIQEMGWITVLVPPRDALKPLTIRTPQARFHGCTVREFAPYLILEGTQADRSK